MDRSAQFKACIKSVASCNDNIHNHHKLMVNLIKKRDFSSFFTKAQKITCQIEKLFTLMIENQQAESNVNHYVLIRNHINHVDRDKIDLFAQNIISFCFKLVHELKVELAIEDISVQNREHKENIIFLIEEYLNQICNIYSEQKAVRVKAIREYKKMSKLDSFSTKTQLTAKDIKMNWNGSSDTQRVYNEFSSSKIQEINGDTSIYSGNEDPDEHFSPEDLQIFEAENEQLYNELSTLTEEVKEIETKVLHITQLQELFTQKVLDQNRNLDHVLSTVVGSTENVKEANEHIRKAIQRNAGLRVWILFFLLVISFTLIFLDWYNP